MDHATLSNGRPNHFDRQLLLVFLVLALAPFCGHLPSFITGLSSNPIWSQSDAVTGVGRQLIPGWAFGDPNVGWTNQALGHLAADDWLRGTIPWWNRYSGLGLPLAGEMQPAAFFLPFVLLLHFQGGMFWLEVSLQFFAGAAAYLLMRELGLGRWTSLVCALLYQFNGTFSWVPNEANLNAIPFLPLLLLGIEFARRDETARLGTLVVALSISGLIFSGFPEAAYINGVMAGVWTFGRFVQERGNTKFISRVILGGLVGLALASPLIVAFADFSATSSIVKHHTVGLLGLDIRGFSGLVIPYIYGPLGTNLGNLRLLFISAGTGGYFPVFLIPLVVLGIASRRDQPISIILSVWLFICVCKTFAWEPITELLNLLPFMRDVMFYRYSGPSWELAFILLVGVALDDLASRPLLIMVGLAVSFGIIVLSVYFAWPWAHVWKWTPQNLKFMTAWLYKAVGIQIIFLVILIFIWTSFRNKQRNIILGIFSIISVMTLFSLPQLSGFHPGEVDQRGISYLRNHVGLGRFYTIGPIQPNYSAYFEIQSLNYNYSPFPDRLLKYINSNLSTTVPGQYGVIFVASFPPMSPSGAMSDIIKFYKNYEFLGVNYFVSTPGFSIDPSVAIPEAGLFPKALVMSRGDVLKFSTKFPRRAIKNKFIVDRVGVLQGNFHNTADGEMKIEICADKKCGVGIGNLSSSIDNNVFNIKLNHAIKLQSYEKFHIVISHLTGSHGDAIWVRSDKDAIITKTNGLKSRVIHAIPQIVLINRIKKHILTGVYQDKLMKIWKFVHPDTFYTTNNIGCTMSDLKFSSLTESCKFKTTLLRREIYMPGWTARVNGKLVPIGVTHGIIQSLRLDPGTNVIQFSFWPPYMTYAVAIFLISILYVGWQFFVVSFLFLSRPL